MDFLLKELKLARGVLFKEDEILLVQDMRPGQGHFFLPGGSVEPGESIPTALAREWDEELGWKIKVGGFFGCLENTWIHERTFDDQKVKIIEVNYLFEVKALPENIAADPRSKESHLKFSWIPVRRLNDVPLLPRPLSTLIPEIRDSGARGTWASTL